MDEREFSRNVPNIQNLRRSYGMASIARRIPNMNTTEIQTPKPKLKRVTRTLAVAQSPEPSVALMLQTVIEKGVTAENVAALESLVGLYDRMQAKQAEKQFAKAFAELQSEMPRVVATKPVPNKDGTVRYRFAPYEEILEQVQPYLSKHGFSVSFNSSVGDGRMTATCTLRHISGHSQSNQFSVRIGQGPPGATETQADGSAKTYAKRGALSDALNIVVDHDDDARMIGKPIGKAIAEDLLNRVKLTGSNMISFLKYAGVTLPPADEIDDHDPIEFFEQISDERFDSLDQLLKIKEAKAI